jgi:hypothetical protein
MQLKYLRIHAIQAALGPLQNHFRRRRMRRFDEFVSSLDSRPITVLDLGGQPGIWEYVRTPLEIVILNLPGIALHAGSDRHRITYVEGDACDLSRYSDSQFDVVFSNSVIEHVGDDRNVRLFCSEAMRVGRTVWIQTPSKHFPIEAHTGMPCWWYYPRGMRRWFINRWRRSLPAWTEMVEGTSFITKQQLQSAFPGCRVVTEWYLGFPKSYTAIRRCIE